MKLLLILLAMALAPMSRAQTFVWAAVEGNSIEPGGFSFVAGERQCTVTKMGQGECRRDGVVTSRFRVPIDDGRIDRLAAATVGDDLVFAYELTDEESMWAKLVRVRAGRLQWRRQVGGLNLALPVARQGDVFVAALAYVARVRLRDGAFRWRRERTYHGEGYESSELRFADRQLILTRRGSSKDDGVKVECLAPETSRSVRCAAAN